MTEHAIIDHGVIVAFRELEAAPSLAGKPYRLVLPVLTVDPPYDPATQRRTGPVLVIGETAVTRTYSVTDKSAAEIEAETDLRRDGIAAQLDAAEDVLRAILAVLVDEFNRHSDRDGLLAAATAAATSLADFKDRIAAVPPVPTRSFADLRDAVRQKLGS